MMVKHFVPHFVFHFVSQAMGKRRHSDKVKDKVEDKVAESRLLKGHLRCVPLVGRNSGTRSNVSLPGRSRRPTRGFILIMVLVVVLLASMVVISLLFVLGAEHTAAAAGNAGEQARTTAMSGVYQAMQAAAQAAGTTDWLDNPALFRDQLVCDDGVRKWFFSVYSLSDYGAIRFGLTDEASKINVYRATETMLEALPNLTPPLAQALLNALQASAPATAVDTNQDASVFAPPAPVPDTTQDASVFAAAFPAPIVRPTGPLTCLDDLLQISGFNSQLLYGSYSNLTGRVDSQAEAATAAVLTGPDGLQVGLRQFLTVCSYDLNTDNDDQPRLNLNQANVDLSSLNLPTNTLGYLETLRRNGQPLAHPAELLEASGTFTNEQGKEVQLSSGITKEQLPVLLDRCTATNQPALVGPVNINTASAKVLAALPGMTDALAEAVVAARVGLTPEARKTPAWLFQEGILNADTFKKVAPYLTTRSYQFRFLVAAYALPAANYCLLEATIDAASKPPAILFLRDVSGLGLPFNPGAAPDSAVEQPLETTGGQNPAGQPSNGQTPPVNSLTNTAL